MSLPKKQYSRSEKFLNYIATGEGELPTPQSRTEIYLDYIARNGGIGGGTGGHYHANKSVLDKISENDLNNTIFETVEG